MDYIKQNLSAVRADIEAAAAATGRPAPLLVAAVKYASDEELTSLIRAGQQHIGENRVQQLLAHAALPDYSNATVHFIGALQTNKVKYIIDKVDMIHSVDSERLAAEIERRAAAIDKKMDVLVEINIGREASKGGVLPENAMELCRAVLQHPHLVLRGLMTMAPRSDSDTYRRYFNEVRELAHTIFAALCPDRTPILSMGMSESMGEAIAAGADIVLVGRRLFVQPDGSVPLPYQAEKNKN